MLVGLTLPYFHIKMAMDAFIIYFYYFLYVILVWTILIKNTI